MSSNAHTFRASRKNNSKEVAQKKLGKGEMVWARKKTAVVWKWKDKRDVLTISSKHKPSFGTCHKQKGQRRNEAKHFS